MSGNREYKSDVFSMLMQDKERALQLYNAMNGSSYDNPEDVEIVIHDGGISLSVRNDASFIVDARLSIYEHQSTVCPNMPVRSLIYFSVILSDMLSDKKKGTKSGKNIYGRRLVKIPTPHFVVFYNGEEEQPEVQELKLSDAFEKQEMIVVCKPQDSKEWYEKMWKYTVELFRSLEDVYKRQAKYLPFDLEFTCGRAYSVCKACYRNESACASPEMCIRDRL